MRTSVLSPIYGYQPDDDVQSVVQAFTQGPPWGTQLQGLGAGPVSMWWARTKARVKQALSSNRAQAFMSAGMHGAFVQDGHDGRHGQIPYGGGPEPQMAAQVAPQLATQMNMLMRLTPQAGTLMRSAGHEIARQRINSYYAAR